MMKKKLMKNDEQEREKRGNIFLKNKQWNMMKKRGKHNEKWWTREKKTMKNDQK
jgi:hypothetical protein